MKFDFAWLKELSRYEDSANQLAELLSSHSLETEVEKFEEFEKIIIAKVTKIASHPDADRLRLITLTDGKRTYSPVVCGAWNFDSGVKVPLALPGAIIPHDLHGHKHSFTLEKAVIRGVESQGMICSAMELGLGENAKGIMVLDKSAPLGVNLSKFFPHSSASLNITSFANRPDTLSYLGIAHEIASLSATKVKFNQAKFVLEKYKSKLLRIKIADNKLCRRYIGVRFTDVLVKESPEFIQTRLINSGLRPINNVVDITNYVMLLTGQPLHAFDASKLLGGIQVRKAYLNEKIKTLDKVDRVLENDMLVIADAKKPVAVAGIMGSDDSSVDEFTNEIILEAANFNAASIRKTAASLGLRTDGSSRHEKRLPLSFTNLGSTLAADLLIKYAQAKPQEVKIVGEKPRKQTVIKLNPAHVDQLLGIKTSPKQQKKIMERFGYLVKGISKFQVIVPSYRSDVILWQDLAEDIGRFYGINDIAAIEPARFTSHHMTDALIDQTDQVIDYLVSLGFSEVHNYAFVSKADLVKWGVDSKKAIGIIRPLSDDQEYLTLNLLFNLLKTAEKNSRYFKKGNFFEINKVFWKEKGIIKEKLYLGMLSFGNKTPLNMLVSAFRELCKRLNIDIKILQEEEQKADIIVNKKSIGRIGTHSISKLNWIGLHLDFEEFLKAIGEPEYQEVSIYPAIEFDISLLAKKDLLWFEIENVVLSLASELVKSIKLFDVFEGKGLPLGKKSMTFRITYQAKDRTLKDEQIKQIHGKILERLTSKLGVEIRD